MEVTKSNQNLENLLTSEEILNSLEVLLINRAV